MDRRVLARGFVVLAAILAALLPGNFLLAQSPAPAPDPLHSGDPASSASRPGPDPKGIFRTPNGRMTPEMQERLAELLQLPKEKLWDELMKWPTFKEMTLQEQAAFVNRLADIRQRLRTQALKKAAELGLKLSPDQEEAFINSYLQQRILIERKIWEETQAKRRQLDEELKSNLKKQYAGEPETP